MKKPTIERRHLAGYFFNLPDKIITFFCFCVSNVVNMIVILLGTKPNLNHDVER